MARLSSYYTLCPLIDQQNVLGVETDSSPGCAIVTLGKNIVKRYKLQDLKQISSWSTKDRLTSQVIFDKTSENYVAVFNGKNIKTWQEQETDLDSVRKYKFLSPIHAVLTSDGFSSIVVMQNGATASLSWAIGNRKLWDSPGLLASGEKISHCQLVCIKNKIYLCMLTQKENVHNYIVVPLKGKNLVEDLDQVSRIELKRSSEKLVGHVVIQDDKSAHLLTLWSHGRLYSYSLIDSTTEFAPGSLISVVTVVNTNHPVVLVALNESTIAGYGANVDEEGAVLFIYNVQFKLVQAFQNLKLFTQDAKLWNIEDKLLLAANRHLAVAPYTLAPQRIEAMLDSTLNFKKDASVEDNDIVVIQESEVADWGKAIPDRVNVNALVHNFKSSIATRVSTYLHEGLNEAAIYQNLIPQLIESKDNSSILWCLNNSEDLPQELFLQLLGYCLKTSSNAGNCPLQNGHDEKSSSDEHESYQNELLNKILSICYTNDSIISSMRALSFDEILTLLTYLTNKLEDESFLNDNSEGILKSNNLSFKWTKLLVDSHYQNYLLSQDSEVLKLLEKLKEVLESQLQLVRDLESLRSMVKRLMDGKLLKSIPNDVNRFYSIEEVKLY